MSGMPCRQVSDCYRDCPTATAKAQAGGPPAALPRASQKGKPEIPSWEGHVEDSTQLCASAEALKTPVLSYTGSRRAAVPDRGPLATPIPALPQGTSVYVPATSTGSWTPFDL